MEYEKIKIYVTKRIAEILEKDAEIFDFLKSDGLTPNRNAFLTALILNYSSTYQERQKFLNELVQSVIKKNSYLQDETIRTISALIINEFNEQYIFDSNEKFDKLISFKPTKATIGIIEYINSYLLENYSLSEYFRNMFKSYCALPQDVREQIIFKENYTLINTAIKDKKRIFISTQNGKQSGMELSPYGFSRSKEEIHIYLMFKQKDACKSIKLSKIKTVTLLEKDAQFDSNDLLLFEKMQKFGVQFPYDIEDTQIVVRLTPRGKALFHKIYIHRPIPSKIENDIFTFNCSALQTIQYFSRFGNDVEILSPDGVRNAIYDFHNSFVKKIDNQ